MLGFGCASALRLSSFSSGLRMTPNASFMSRNMPMRGPPYMNGFSPNAIFCGSAGSMRQAIEVPSP